MTKVEEEETEAECLNIFLFTEMLEGIEHVPVEINRQDVGHSQLIIMSNRRFRESIFMSFFPMRVLSLAMF